MVSIVGKLTKNYIKDQVRQGGHEDRIIALYRMVYEAAKAEFPEDNKPTLDSFLKECFEASLRPIGISKLEVYENLIRQIVKSKEKKEIAIVLPTFDQICTFKEEFWESLNAVPSYLIYPPTVDNFNKLEFINCTIRFITYQAQMKGIRIDQVYYSAHLTSKQKSEAFVNLLPCVGSNENMIEFH
jgi:hypothetical protein